MSSFLLSYSKLVPVWDMEHLFILCSQSLKTLLRNGQLQGCNSNNCSDYPADQNQPTEHNTHTNIICASLSVYISCLGSYYPHPFPSFLISVGETVYIVLGHLRTVFGQISWWEQAWCNYPHKTKTIIVMVIIIYYYFSWYVSPFWRVNLAEQGHGFN